MILVYCRFGDSRFCYELAKTVARLHWLTSLLRATRGATLRSNRVREVA